MFGIRMSWVVILSLLLGSWAGLARGQDKQGEAELPVLEGIVVNHVGGGIGGLTVNVYRGDEKVGETSTTGTGEFAIPLNIKEKCALVVKINGEGYTPVEMKTAFDPEDPPYVDTELSGSLNVTGRVVGLPDEKPVADAAVKLAFQSKVVEAKTQADGTFELENVAPGPARLEVEADGFGRERFEFVVGERGSPLKVVLKKERVIEITVVDDLDRPVVGASVELKVELFSGEGDLRIQKTGKDGKSIFRNIHYDAAIGRARILHPDHVQTEEFAHVIQVDADKLVAAGRFVLPRAAKIVGQVTEAVTGNPIHSARVFAGTPGQGFVPVSFTDYQGKFSLSGLPAGKVPVTVHRADYVPSLEEASCVLGKTVTVNLDLVRGQPIGGVVQASEGQPLAGYVVASMPWKGYDTLSLRVFTDDKGRFSFEDAPPGELLFAVLAPDLQPIQKDIKLTAGKTDHVVKIATPKLPLAGGGIKKGEAVPDLTLTTMDGRKVRLAAPDGKYVLLDFWATWCGPCVGEVPNLQEVWRKLKDRDDFLLVSVSLDRSEKALRSFLEKTHMPWLHVYGDKSGASEAADKFQVTAIPSTFLIGPDGKLLATGLRGPELIKQLLDILPGRPSDKRPAPILR